MKSPHQPTNHDVSGFFPLGLETTPRWDSKVKAPKKPLPHCTDLSAIRGADVLFFLDDDNFRIGMRKEHGLHIDERSLRRKIQAEARSLRPVAAYCATVHDKRDGFFARDGWEVVAVPHEVVHTFSGPILKANIDMYLCVEVGLRAAYSGAPRSDCTLIGSGDGDLCVAIARTLKRHFPDQRVLTLSVPGTTSQRLTSMADIFDGHIDVGLDLAQELQTEWPSKATFQTRNDIRCA